MGYRIRAQPTPPFHTLVGFVTERHWALRLPGFEQWLADHPDRPLVLECARVTGFSPQALAALANFIRSSGRRVRLKNWRAKFAKAVLPQLLIDRATGAAPQTALAALVDRLRALEAELIRIRTRLEWYRMARPGG